MDAARPPFRRRSADAQPDRSSIGAPTEPVEPIGRDLEADVVVVGSRVAGAATALLLARAGHDVVLVDRTRHPSDTLSTHAIARGGVVQLARWGVLDAVVATGAPEIREVSFHTDAGVIRRTVKAMAGVDHLLAPRRHALDPVLVDAAVDAGVRCYDGVAVTDVVVDPTGRVGGVVLREGSGGSRTVRAAHVVGADGLRSTVARSVGSPVVEARPSRAATHYRYVAGLDGTGMEYHLGGGAFAGVFPTNGGQACLWVCTPSSWIPRRHESADGRRGLFDGLLARVSPPLAERVERATSTSPVRGAVDLPNQVRRGAGPGWWLVGDAAYHRDPITGHGITDALRDAELLAEAIHASSTGGREELARVGYERCRRAALGPIFDLTCELASFPGEERFGTLQRELSGLLSAEALRLHRLGPRPWTRSAVPA
jgi:flavin-dependent dehydrogenase